jgi:tetratricopeptide (TPR) repeat protein
VFARVAEAFDTLSRVDKRREYDAALLDDGPEIDVNRLAQAEALFRKGEVLLKMGNFRGALEFLKPAVDLWPNEADYQAGCGWALFRTTPPDAAQARVHLGKAIELAPENPESHHRMSQILQALGEKEAAFEHAARAKMLES